jgi:hypothetical protein
VPMLSQPDFVLDVIRKAATAVQKNEGSVLKVANRFPFSTDRLEAVCPNLERHTIFKRPVPICRLVSSDRWAAIVN